MSGNLDWILNLSKRNFWAIHDFRRLWKPTSRTINSSVMYFNTKEYNYVWEKFQQQSLGSIMNNYKGDQDFITATVEPRSLRYFDLDRIVSWRWQIVNDGFRQRKTPSAKITEIKIPSAASIVVFHGDPKPHQVQENIIKDLWC